MGAAVLRAGLGRGRLGGLGECGLGWLGCSASWVEDGVYGALGNHWLAAQRCRCLVEELLGMYTISNDAKGELLLDLKLKLKL